MRYFFPVSDGSSTIDDDESTVLSSPDVAMIDAAVIAGELAQDGEWYNGHVVYVTDEHGNEIGRVPVVTAFMSLRRTPAENIALTILARDGIAAIWQLNEAAAEAHRTGRPTRSLPPPLWRSLTLRRTLGFVPRECASSQFNRLLLGTPRFPTSRLDRPTARSWQPSKATARVHQDIASLARAVATSRLGSGIPPPPPTALPTLPIPKRLLRAQRHGDRPGS
jgi:hypothetical protein